MFKPTHPKDKGGAPNIKRPAQVVVSNDHERGIYQKTVDEHKANGKMVIPGFLRIEQKIVNGKTIYTYPITRDSNSDTITELKLDRNDAFKVTHLGFFLMKRVNTLIGHEVLQTYPNYIRFPQNGSPISFDPTHLDAFYNGKLGLSVGQTKWIEAMDTRRFRIVPQAQESFTTNGNTPPSLISYVAHSEQEEKTGFIDMTPQITLDGNEKNSLFVEAPIQAGHLVANTVANTDNFLVIIMRGLLITARK